LREKISFIVKKFFFWYLKSSMKYRIFFFSGISLFCVLGVLFFSPQLFAAFDRWKAGQEQEKLLQEFPLSSFSEEDSLLLSTSQKKNSISLEVLPLEEKYSPLESFLYSLPKNPPIKKLLSVPFICQNPFQNTEGWKWHKESCEEAAALQAILFFQKKELSPQNAHEKFLDMIAWQKEHMGGHRDLYGEEMRMFLRDYFSLSDDEVFFLPEIDFPLLKKILAADIPLIVPVNGQSIRNPFYPHDGYHMLTVVGYTEDRIVTNDVGTKRGEKYPYNGETFFAANADEGGGAFVILPEAFSSSL